MMYVVEYGFDDVFHFMYLKTLKYFKGAIKIFDHLYDNVLLLCDLRIP